MGDQIQSIYDVYEYIGVSCRAPFMVSYRDAFGEWHKSTFEHAPDWEYWEKLDQDFQKRILRHISH